MLRDRRAGLNVGVRGRGRVTFPEINIKLLNSLLFLPKQLVGPVWTGGCNIIGEEIPVMHYTIAGAEWKKFEHWNLKTSRSLETASSESEHYIFETEPVSFTDDDIREGVAAPPLSHFMPLRNQSKTNAEDSFKEACRLSS